MVPLLNVTWAILFNPSADTRCDWLAIRDSASSTAVLSDCSVGLDDIFYLASAETLLCFVLDTTIPKAPL